MADAEYVAMLERQLENVSLSSENKEKLIESFVAVDENRNGYLDVDEVRAAFEAVGHCPPQYKIRDAIKKLDQDHDKRLSPAEFAAVYNELASDAVAEGFKVAVKAKRDIVTKSGHSTVEGTQHSYSPEEMVAFCNWMNQSLKDDPDLKAHGLPINPEDEDRFFESLTDGIILCKMINLSQKDTIDERAINKKKSPNRAVQIHRDQENLNLALNSASAIGCNIVNIDGNDLKEKKAHLVLGLLWQVIRIGLFAAFDLARTPALAVLLREGEELEDLMNLSPELLLLRWMNYHLQKSDKYKASAKQGKEIMNFSGDIKDSYAYLCLLEQIQPEQQDDDYTGEMILADTNKHPGTDKDSLVKRAAYMLNEADKIGCRAFVTEYDVAKGTQKLNLAFVAHMFNTFPALEDTGEKEIIVETREEKTYRNWMNSLGVAPRVNRIYNDLTDGVVFSQLYERVKPGVMDKRKIVTPPFPKLGANLKKLENCHCIIDVGKELKYSLVGIGGENIRAGDQIPTLALTWQIMRGYTLGILEGLNEKGGGGEKAIIAWTNQTLQDAGKSTSISSFKDSSIATSHVVLDLVDAVGGADTIDYSNVKPGSDDEEKQSNARYAISMARKIGARVYALPDDLWEVNAKMVMTIFACIMARAMQKNEENQ